MKKILFSTKTLAVAVLPLLISGCANDDAAQGNASKQPDTKGMTEFAVVDNAANAKTASVTRTAGIYTGHSIKFYWTSGDCLWLNNASTLKESNLSTIPNTNGREETAKFYFDGTYTNESYPVRYTGLGNNSGDKVTIKSEQTQQLPNDGSHIGADGDCGTAIARRQSDGSYKFMLDHKASYLTFAPYYSTDELASEVTIKKIKVTANQNLAGTYAFNDNGIHTASVTNASNSITLTLTGTFNIPQASDYNKNGAIMVIAPGTYTNFKVEYTLADSRTGVTGTVSKTYASVTFSEGKNTPIKFNLDMARYEMKYYMWDAGSHFWNNYSGTLPVADGEAAPFMAPGTTHWFNKSETNLTAANSCINCPNANEATIYAFHGDPHWDGETLWTMNKHLYVGGMWFKKLRYCEGGPYTSPVEIYSPSGKDYRDNSIWRLWQEEEVETYHNAWTTPVHAKTKPADTSKYFYLPAMGYLNNHTNDGQLRIGAGAGGYAGAYWTSTGLLLPHGPRAIALYFSEDAVGLEVDDRYWAYPRFENPTD